MPISTQSPDRWIHCLMGAPFDERDVGRTKILEQEIVAAATDGGVLATDAQIVDHNVVGVSPADRGPFPTWGDGQKRLPERARRRQSVDAAWWVDAWRPLPTEIGPVSAQLHAAPKRYVLRRETNEPRTRRMWPARLARRNGYYAAKAMNTSAAVRIWNPTRLNIHCSLDAWPTSPSTTIELTPQMNE